MNQPAIDLTTDEDIERALEEARSRPPRPRALSAEYQPALDVLVLHIDNGRRLFIPREDIQGLENATPSQLAEIEILSGTNIGFTQIDVNLYLPYLLEGRLGTEAWMQSRHYTPIAA